MEKVQTYRWEITRELNTRKGFYASQIERGKMTKEQANKQYSHLKDALRLLAGEQPVNCQAQQVKNELWREYKMRQRVYPRQISMRLMTKAESQSKLRVWKEIIDHLFPAVAKKEGSNGIDLFNQPQ